jgi:hypothetical protein
VGSEAYARISAVTRQSFDFGKIVAFSAIRPQIVCIYKAPFRIDILYLTYVHLQPCV